MRTSCCISCLSINIGTLHVLVINATCIHALSYCWEITKQLLLMMRRKQVEIRKLPLPIGTTSNAFDLSLSVASFGDCLAIDHMQKPYQKLELTVAPNMNKREKNLGREITAPSFVHKIIFSCIHLLRVATSLVDINEAHPLQKLSVCQVVIITLRLGHIVSSMLCL